MRGSHKIHKNWASTNSNDFTVDVFASFELESFSFLRECSIPGLEGKELEFLGLMDCPDNPCERPDIPAKRVIMWLKFKCERSEPAKNNSYIVNMYLEKFILSMTI